MPRRNKDRRVKLQYQMSFKKMCDLLGVTPVQRVKLIRYLQKEEVDNLKK